jgi:hypothetical protein
MTGQPKAIFTLEVTLAIQQQELWPDGSIRYTGSNNRLTVNETIQLGAMDFLSMTHILANLHDSVMAIKPEKKEESKENE